MIRRGHMRLVGAEPWLTEPDREEWTSAGGSKCLIRRGYFGAWCGYVGIDPGHPWHGLGLFDIPAIVHGGCAWSGPLGPEGSQWWIGFDCGHAWDIQPGLLALCPDHTWPGCEYRDLAYVRRETNELAAQTEAAAGGSMFMQGSGEA